MYELYREDDDHVMTIEKFNCGNLSEYWLELTNKKTLATQTLQAKTKESIMFDDRCTIASIAQKLNNWGVPSQKVYKRIPENI